MSEQREKLIIPESRSYGELQEVHVELMFDDPYALHENRDTDYEVWFYTVLDKSDGVEKSLTAYKGLHNNIQKTGGVKGSILSLGRVGSRKETQWFVKWTKGPRREPGGSEQSAPQPHKAEERPVPGTSSVYTPYTEEETAAMLELCNHHLDLYEKFYGEVVLRPNFRKMSEDQLARLATGAMISVARTYRRGMTVAQPVTEEPLFDDEPAF